MYSLIYVYYFSSDKCLLMVHHYWMLIIWYVTIPFYVCMNVITFSHTCLYVYMLIRIHAYPYTIIDRCTNTTIQADVFCFLSNKSKQTMTSRQNTLIHSSKHEASTHTFISLKLLNSIFIKKLIIIIIMNI